ncbi:YggT family protein [Sulfurimonas sp.]|uniref:YggT family protein n=1 Tax=Sulfurimonas sp. TaxID=2022749 RepID=UPI0025D190CE|nr:YggT family protein [Sulfurimonas sp.]MDD5156974.1 YggT family protein [Sulfurimonas sp.]
MSILVEIIQGFGAIILSLINIYIWLVIITALLSFVNPDPYNPIVQFLYRVTNPAYRLVRKYIKTNFNGLDLAPMIIIIALQLLIVVINSLLHTL